MTDRALSFGPVAAAYERFRPGYPDRLIDEVLAYARVPIRTAVEIGAGTGKATRAFAARGIAVTATDPDAAMLAELRRHVPPSVSIIQAALEDLTVTRAYDLVFAAAALHWTEPHRRWARVAALLHPDGVFAAFGGQLNIDDEGFDDAVRAVRTRFLPSDEVASPAGLTSPDGSPDDSPEDTADETAMQWPGSELSRSAEFTDVAQLRIERRLTMSADDYLGHLSTVSAYIQLPTAARERLFEQLLTVLPARVPLNADVTLHLARVAGTGAGVPDEDQTLNPR